ncbi:MAG: ribosome recycling factor [Candidatus Taylorbacteria bacterium]|nr:ribosome recycling factor [Candidatus Taylorbacteria bacterium]
MYDFSKFKQKIKENEEWLKREFVGVRTGRASPALLDAILVESYGALVPITQVGNISTEDSRTIRITPWETTMSKHIEKAIGIANLGVAVALDDKGVRVSFPELTSERRTEIVKIAKEKLEQSKVSIRIARDASIKDIQAKEKEGGLGKDDVQRFKTELQKLVDGANKSLEALFEKKEKEIIS